MPEAHSPTARGRHLARELRRLRERAGLSPEQVANQVGGSRFKVGNIENGKVKGQIPYVEAMLDLYGVVDETRAKLIDLAKNAWRRGWWTNYADVVGRYPADEDDASGIRSWEPQLVPGLLQTPDYSQAVTHAALPDASEEYIQRRLQARMARQALLVREDAPELHAILNEAALRTPIGGTDVMRAQLRHLVEQAKRANITIYLLQQATGAHAGLEGSFTILSFAEEEVLDVAYSESLLGGVYGESLEDITRCNNAWERVREAALDPSKSAAHLAAMSEE